MNVHFEGFRQEGLVFINAAQAEQLRHVWVRSEDVLFNITGASIGRVTTAPPEMEGARVNQHVCIIRPTEVLVPKFLSYFLATPEQQALIKSNQVGGTRQAITKAMLLNWQIPLPSGYEQRLIVELLDQAYTVRRQRLEADTLWLRILPALFHRIFGDPTRNEGAWPVEPLGRSLAAIESGWSPICESRPAQNEEWGVLKLGAVTTNHYLDSENKALPAVLTPEPRLEVKKGDLLFSRKNTIELVGACAFVFETQPRMLLPDLIFRLRLRDDSQLHPLFLWGLLTNSGMRSAIQALAGGSAGSMPNISKGRLEGLMIQKPPFSLQEQFAGLVEHVHENTVSAEATRNTIEKLFEAMLHRAFTGKLTARWRERHMNEILEEMEQQPRYLHGDERASCLN
jgi:type I restriction enzyme S subunit